MKKATIFLIILIIVMISALLNSIPKKQVVIEERIKLYMDEISPNIIQVCNDLYGDCTEEQLAESKKNFERVIRVQYEYENLFTVRLKNNLLVFVISILYIVIYVVLRKSHRKDIYG